MTFGVADNPPDFDVVVQDPIHQALIVRNPGFENKINSISPKRPFYQDAVDWGEAWLKGKGL